MCIRDSLDEALPSGDDSRTFHPVYTSAAAPIPQTTVWVRGGAAVASPARACIAPTRTAARSWPRSSTARAKRSSSIRSRSWASLGRRLIHPGEGEYPGQRGHDRQLDQPKSTRPARQPALAGSTPPPARPPLRPGAGSVASASPAHELRRLVPAPEQLVGARARRCPALRRQLRGALRPAPAGDGRGQPEAGSATSSLYLLARFRTSAARFPGGDNPGASALGLVRLAQVVHRLTGCTCRPSSASPSWSNSGPPPPTTRPGRSSVPGPAKSCSASCSVLAYVAAEPYRREIKGMRNLQEGRHDLARHLFHGRRGELQ